jgi:hypothetical protein
MGARQMGKRPSCAAPLRRLTRVLSPEPVRGGGPASPIYYTSIAGTRVAVGPSQPVNQSPRPVPNFANASCGTKESRDFQHLSEVRTRAFTIDPLLAREVLLCTSSDNKNPRFAGILEPSDGLEPSTPSLPWRFWGGKAGHGRALASTMCLQSEGFVDVGRDRACPRVLSLVYPSRTRGLLSDRKTDNAHSRGSPFSRRSGACGCGALWVR